MNEQTEEHHPAMIGYGEGIDLSTKVIYSNKCHQQVITENTQQGKFSQGKNMPLLFLFV